eukprot:scaffold2176_cov350-Prasinococcus_capsulatus_cf.AAC.16
MRAPSTVCWAHSFWSPGAHAATCKAEPAGWQCAHGPLNTTTAITANTQETRSCKCPVQMWAEVRAAFSRGAYPYAPPSGPSSLPASPPGHELVQTPPPSTPQAMP